MQSSVFNRLVTFLVWLLAAGSVVFWALKWTKGPGLPLAAAQAAPSQMQAPDATALAKALGGGQVATNLVAKTQENTQANSQNSTLLASRFVLTGVVTGKPGVALLAVDGKPARAFRVGAQLASDAVLYSIAPGKALLAASNSGPALLTLELPKQTTALIGTVQPARPAASPAPTIAPTFAPTAVPAPPALAPPAGMQGSNQGFAQPMDAAAQGALALPKAARALANRVREGAGGPANESQAPNTSSQ
jgi:general secretion pathway protein C